VGYLVVFFSLLCLDTTKLALFSGSSIRTREETPIFTPNKRVKIRHRTAYECPEMVKRYSSTLSLTSVVSGWVVSTTPWPYYPSTNDPVSTVQDIGWAPQAVTENVAPPPGFKLVPSRWSSFFFQNCGKINAVNELAGFIWLRIGTGGGLL